MGDENKMTLLQFGQSIKTKYPEYKDVDDTELANKMLAKYPEYQSNIIADPQKKSPSETEPSNLSAGLSEPPKQDSQPLEQNGGGDNTPVSLPDSYIKNRANTKDLVAGNTYDVGNGKSKRWNGQIFEKQTSDYLKPLMDYTINGSINVGDINVPKVEKQDSVVNKGVVGDQKANIAEAYTKTDELQSQAVDKVKENELLSSFQPVQQLNQLTELYKQAPDDATKEAVQKQIDELASKPLIDDSFVGTRFYQGDNPVYQNMQPDLKVDQALEDFKGELPELPKPKTVGEAYSTIKNNQDFIADVQGDSQLLNSITETEQLKALDAADQQRLLEIKQNEPDKYPEEFAKAVQESKTDANVATSFLRGLNNSIEGTFNAFEYAGMSPDELLQTMKREYVKNQLFGVHADGRLAGTAEGIGGAVPDIAVSMTPMGLTGMVAMQSLRHPNEALKAYYFDSFSKGETPDYNQAMKYAGISTLLNAALMGGAGAVAKGGAPIVGDTWKEMGLNFLKSTTKVAAKDAAIFGMGGKALQDINNEAFGVAHDNDYGKAAMDMALFGAVMYTIVQGRNTILKKLSPKEIDNAITSTAYMPKEMVAAQIQDGIATGTLTPEQGAELSNKWERARKIVNELPVELTLDQVNKIEPYYAENERLVEQAKDATPTMKKVLMDKVAQNDKAVLIEAAVPLTEEEKAEYNRLITGDAENKGVDRERLKYLRDRMKAASQTESRRIEAKKVEVAPKEEVKQEQPKEEPATEETPAEQATEPTEEKPVEEKQLSRAEIAKQRKQLLQKEPNSLREAIMQYFVGGGKVTPEDLKRYTGYSGKDSQSLFWAKKGKDKGGMPVDRIANEVFGNWKGGDIDEQSIINEIFDVLTTYGNRSSMESDLRGAKEQDDFIAEHGVSKAEYDRMVEQSALAEDVKTDFPEIAENIDLATDIVNGVKLTEADYDSIDKYLNQFKDANGEIDWDKALLKADEVFNNETVVLSGEALNQFNTIFENPNNRSEYERKGIQREKAANDGNGEEITSERRREENRSKLEVAKAEYEKVNSDYEATQKALSKDLSDKQGNMFGGNKQKLFDDTAEINTRAKGLGKERDRLKEEVDKYQKLVDEDMDGQGDVFEPTTKTNDDWIKEGWENIKDALSSPSGTLALNPKLLIGIAKIGRGLIGKTINGTVVTWDNLLKYLKQTLKDGGFFTSKQIEKDFEESKSDILAEAKKLEQKSFLKTVQDSNATDAELNKQASEMDNFYEVINNKDTIKKVNDEMAKNGISATKEKVLSNSTPDAEKSASAIQLLRHYQKVGDYDSAIEVLDAYDKQLREAGRFIQAASLWNKLSPETVVRVANREAKKVGADLLPEVQANILRMMDEVSKMPEGTEKDKKTMEVLNYVAGQLPNTLGELFDAYRYQNMLSNPKSHMRNIYSNMFNMLITRPIDMASEAAYDLFRSPFNEAARDMKFAAIPKYYKDIFTTVPNASYGFMEAFKNGYITNKVMETGSVGGKIQALRAANIPKSLTLIPRFMEAQDKFFSTLIAQGEKSRLMAGGISEAEATTRSHRLAESYLYREMLGDEETLKNESKVVRALDSIGVLAMKGKSLPGVGKAWQWFVPFVTTPINVAKVGVQHSPLGFIGGSYSKEQVARATFGTLISFGGAVAAMNGNTTWAIPKDKKEKDLFYASGMKPYSYRVGNTWYPMAYAGPFAMALAIPAALKHYTQDTKTSLTDGESEKVSAALMSMGGYITSQTPLSGMDALARTASGEDDYTLPKTLAFTSEQAIPMIGLIKFTNTILDPVYRKSKGYAESIEKDMPVISKDLEAYKNPDGTDATRDNINYFMPYDIGLTKEQYELPLLERRKIMQQKEAMRKLRDKNVQSNDPKEIKKMLDEAAAAQRAKN